MVIDNPEAQQNQFVMLRRYRDLSAAIVVKAILDSAAIECLLGDENMVRLYWFWSNLLGGVKLWVREQDLDQAASLIG
jgi:hypothetical protein